MSYLQNQMNVLKFDKRLLEINLKSGTITQAEYDQHLAALADQEANSQKIDLGADSSTDSATNVAEEAPTQPQVDAVQQQPTMPTNTDPFGAGF